MFLDMDDNSKFVTTTRYFRTKKEDSIIIMVTIIKLEHHDAALILESFPLLFSFTPFAWIHKA